MVVFSLQFQMMIAGEWHLGGMRHDDGGEDTLYLTCQINFLLILKDIVAGNPSGS